LKMKAANASAITLSQLPVCALVVFIKSNALLKIRLAAYPIKTPTNKNTAQGVYLGGACCQLNIMSMGKCDWMLRILRPC
jgi:hypothetical protein